MLFMLQNSTRKALKSLQGLGGVYGLVVACDEVQFPGALVGHFMLQRVNRNATCE